MQYVGIVECISSSQLYITDILALGYKPLVIYPNVTINEHLLEYRELIRKNIGDAAEFIDEGPDYAEFLERIRKYDLKAVVPGADSGVYLSDRLSKDLGLIGNNPDTVELRTTKKGMSEALEKAGLRHILTGLVTCEDDIGKFVRDNDLDKFVLKYSHGAGTFGLKICSDIDDGVAHYRKMVTSAEGSISEGSEILIQEYIGGTEYIVNTASFNGKHLLTDIWVYTKVVLPDGNLAYDRNDLVKDLLPGHNALVEYAFKVLDAVDLKYGVCHSEFKIDRKGPVLIETNPRPMGAGMTAPFLDECLGHHMTNIGLASILDPGLFDKMKNIPYRPRKYAMMKFLKVPEDMEGDFSPLRLMVERLDSYRETLFFGGPGVQKYRRTIDLDTSPLYVKLINEDYGRLMKDYNLIHLLETEYFHVLYSTDPTLKGTAKVTDKSLVLSLLDPMRKICYIDNYGAMAYQYNESHPADTKEVFDGAIYGKCDAGTLHNRYLSMLSSMGQVRRGGMFAFLPEAFEELPCGRATAEALLKFMGFNLLVSSSEIQNIVRGERL